MAEQTSSPHRSGERIDVKELIRHSSRRVLVEDLLRKGTQTIALLSKDKIDELVNQAVRTIVNKYRALTAGLEQVEREARQEFREQLRRSQKPAFDVVRPSEPAGNGHPRPAPALPIADAGLNAEVAALAAELLRDERALLEQEGGGAEALAEFDRVKNKLEALLRRDVRRSGELFYGAGRSARDKEVKLLEKRLAKMRDQLRQFEEAFKKLSAQKLIGSAQMQSVLRDLGVPEEDQNAEKKREIVKVILQQNLRLRRELRELEREQAAQAGLRDGPGDTAA